MAVIVHKWNDLNAPDFTLESNGAACLFAMLRHFAVDTFGWTLIHDSTRRATGTTTEGRFILQHPSNAFVCVWDEDGDDVISGLGDAGYSDGSVTNYQSGLVSQAGSVQRQDCNSPGYWVYWHLVYDEASHTLFFEAAGSSYGDINYTSNGYIYRAQVYISTAATPSAARDTFAVFGSGGKSGNTYGTASSLSSALFDGLTTLKKLDGSPANGDALMWLRENSTVSAQNFSSDSAADRLTILKPLYLSLPNLWSRYPDSRDFSSPIGQLRGIFAIDSADHGDIDHWLDVHYPASDRSSGGSRFGFQVTLAGKDYLITADNRQWFGVISLDPSDYGDMA